MQLFVDAGPQTWGDDSDAVLIRSGCLVDSLPGPFGYEHHLSNETFGAGSLEAWTEDAQAAPKEEAQAQLLLSCSAREAQKLRCSARNRGQGCYSSPSFPSLERQLFKDCLP